MILIEQMVSHFNISFTYLNPSTINTTIKTPIYYLPNELKQGVNLTEGEVH